MFRALGIVPALSALAHAVPGSDVLVADVVYHFRDKNGVGWTISEGAVTVTLALGAKPTLTIAGKRTMNDAQLKTGGWLASRKGDSVANEKFELLELARDAATGAITFRFDPVHDHVTVRCVPARPAGLARTTLYECTFTGFAWRAAPRLPELHHPLVLDANPKARLRIRNTLTGASKPQFGERTLAEAAPLPPPPKR